MSNHPKAEKAAKEIKRMMAEGRTRHQSDYERLDNVQCHIGNLLGEIAELEARIAELEALVREVYLIEPSWGNDALMVERSCAEWLIDAHRLCPPTQQEDQQ